MSEWQLKTAVAFFIFNRPDTTARVFEAIRRAAPPQLLVVADGARPGREGEAERCAAARAIVERVDWPCEVLTNFSEANLGCKRRVASGLDWVFSLVEEAIILEDDCLPHPTFFRFCEELLASYRHDQRIMMISGNNFQFGERRSDDSYYFSCYPHIWGWACWRRSWERCDWNLESWPRLRDEGWLDDFFGKRDCSRFWRKVFDEVYHGRVDAWSHHLTFACLVQQGLCILPTVNLVSNIGFGGDATHTMVKGKLSEIPTEPMTFPLRHPPFLLRDQRADRRTAQDQFLIPSFPVRLLRAVVALCRLAAGSGRG